MSFEEIAIEILNQATNGEMGTTTVIETSRKLTQAHYQSQRELLQNMLLQYPDGSDYTYIKTWFEREIAKLDNLEAKE